MPATIIQSYQLGQDSTFIQRVQEALLAYAYTVETELTSVTNHTARAAFASKVVGDSASYAPELAQLISAVDTASGTAYVGTQPPSTNNITDSAIMADIPIAFNLLAGL